MLKKLKISIASVMALSLFAVSAVAIPAIASAQDQNPNINVNSSLCKGAGLDVTNAGQESSANCDTSSNGSGLNTLLTRIVNIISVIVGVIAVIMIIYGGFRYITSGGDSGKVTSAKNTILYAIIGLVIVALAQFIVRFVIGASSKIS